MEPGNVVERAEQLVADYPPGREQTVAFNQFLQELNASERAVFEGFCEELRAAHRAAQVRVEMNSVFALSEQLQTLLKTGGCGQLGIEW